jgi:hypothetical protein
MITPYTTKETSRKCIIQRNQRQKSKIKKRNFQEENLSTDYQQVIIT